MLASIETVVFDLDGTLLDRRRSFERFVRGQWERYSHVLQPVGQPQFVQTLIELDRDGYAPRKELFAGMLARFGLSLELGETLLRDYRTGFPSACSLFSDAAHTLAALRAAGFKLGLITNGSVRMQTGKLRCLALEPAFVGDHPEVDVSGARGVGMKSIWRRDPTVSRTVEADAIIEELRDLLEVLGLECDGEDG